MKRTLIFDYAITGHHPEYINHLYLGAGNKSQEEFVFLVNPELFSNVNILSWPKFSNVRIIHLQPEELLLPESGSFLASLKLCKILRKYVVNEHVTHIFLNSIMIFLPFLPFFSGRNTLVSGIVYSIQTRKERANGFITRILDLIKYQIFVRSNAFQSIFLLNDLASCRLLNHTFKTKVFKFLPDPVLPIPINEGENLREEYNISKNVKVYLHFGGLTIRKGTMDLIKAISLLDWKTQSETCFIFAGKVGVEIREDFYKNINFLAKKARVIVFDNYCKYSLLGSLSAIADYIVLPYKDKSRSSGVLGYSAQFGAPVIGPSEGLIGSLIRKYKLGYCYKIDNPETLSGIIARHTVMPLMRVNGESYLSDNSIYNFQKTIIG